MAYPKPWSGMRQATRMINAVPGILAIFQNVVPGREPEFEEWFQHEHLPERMAVQGSCSDDDTRQYRGIRTTSIFT
jgi:hypothetical protein